LTHFDGSGDLVPLPLHLFVAGNACGDADGEALALWTAVECRIVLDSFRNLSQNREGFGDPVQSTVNPCKGFIVDDQIGCIMGGMQQGYSLLVSSPDQIGRCRSGHPEDFVMVRSLLNPLKELIELQVSFAHILGVIPWFESATRSSFDHASPLILEDRDIVLFFLAAGVGELRVATIIL
jgi:hypothetical protein